MRYSCARMESGLLLSLLIATSASAVTMAWTPIGNPGNACDHPVSQDCFGAVGYAYSIGTYEVTNAQYAEFLNAVAVFDTREYYNPRMGDVSDWGGIARSGSQRSYSYAPIAGRANMPVNNVTFFNALRFANWMNNGQGNSDTETGAYTLDGLTTPSNATTVTRNAGATIALTSEDEWYKAAYYDPSTATYFDYPTGSDATTICAGPSAGANRANCDYAVGDLTNVGSYTGSASPYGTFDQGGNALEWNESINQNDNRYRGIRGGSFGSSAPALAESWRSAFPATLAGSGFRLTMIPVPEPGTGLLVIAGLLGLAGWRRRRA